MATLPFETREAAGRMLAGKLAAYAEKKNVLVLALVRGGVVVGHATAQILGLPLYPYVVRKIGHPDHREFALGAIAEGGSTSLDESTMRTYGIEWEDIQPIIDEEMAELKRRKAVYTVKPRPLLKGKTIILTDDGAATGSTLFAAIDDLKKAGVKKIVIAIPVAPPDTASILKGRVHELHVLATPEPFDAVGKWYRKFEQVEDEEVMALLREKTAAA